MELPEGADRDFTASAFIVDNDRVLLMKHAKLGMWLQPGGHVEEREMPHETARREAREETGVRIAIHEDFVPMTSPDESSNLPEPFSINLHRIEDGHYHCDFGFLALKSDEDEATHADEHEGLRWFSREELRGGDHEMPAQTRETALDALSYLE